MKSERPDFFDTYSIFEYGVQTMKEGKYEMARASFQMALKLDPCNILCIEKLMILTFASGEYTMCLMYANRLLEYTAFNMKAQRIKHSINNYFNSDLLNDKFGDFGEEYLTQGSIESFYSYDKIKEFDLPNIEADMKILENKLHDNTHKYTWYGFLKQYEEILQKDIPLINLKLFNLENIWKHLGQKICDLDSTKNIHENFEMQYLYLHEDCLEKSIKLSLEDNEEIITLSPQKRLSKRKKNMDDTSALDTPDLYVIKRRSARVKNVNKIKDATTPKTSFLDELLNLESILPQITGFLALKDTLWGSTFPTAQSTISVLGINSCQLNQLSPKLIKLFPNYVLKLMDGSPNTQHIVTNNLLNENKDIRAFFAKLIHLPTNLPLDTATGEGSSMEIASYKPPLLRVIRDTLLNLSLLSTLSSTKSFLAYRHIGTVWDPTFQRSFLDLFANYIDVRHPCGLPNYQELIGDDTTYVYQAEDEICSLLCPCGIRCALSNGTKSLILLLSTVEVRVDIHLQDCIIRGGANRGTANDSPNVFSPTSKASGREETSLNDRDLTRYCALVEKALSDFDLDFVVEGGDDMGKPLHQLDDQMATLKLTNQFIRFYLSIRFYRLQILLGYALRFDSLPNQSQGGRDPNSDDEGLYAGYLKKCRYLFSKANMFATFLDPKSIGGNIVCWTMRIPHCSIFNVWSEEILETGPWCPCCPTDVNSLASPDDHFATLASVRKYEQVGLPLSSKSLDAISLHVGLSDKSILPDTCDTKSSTKELSNYDTHSVPLNYLTQCLHALLWNNYVPEPLIPRVKGMIEKLVEMISYSLEQSRTIIFHQPDHTSTFVSSVNHDDIFRSHLDKYLTTPGEQTIDTKISPTTTLLYELLLLVFTTVYSIERSKLSSASAFHRKEWNQRNTSNVKGTEPTPSLAPFLALYQIISAFENRTNESTTKCSESDVPSTRTSFPPSLKFLDMCHGYLGKHSLCTLGGGRFLKIYVDAFYCEAQQVANLLHNHSLITVGEPSTVSPLKLSEDTIEGLEDYKESLKERIEQGFFCMYEFTQKKWRMKYLKDHHSLPKVVFTWDQATTLFNFLKPFSPPEFDSRTYTINSEVKDMLEYMLKFYHCLNVMSQPGGSQDVDILNFLDVGLSLEIGRKLRTTTEFINEGILPNEDDRTQREQPSAVTDQGEYSSVLYEIYYLLADYYFKNMYTEHALKYYILDLCHNPDHFDAWAGVALVKSSDFEHKLRTINLDFKEFPFSPGYRAMLSCFEKALSYKPSSTSLWVENGALAYMLYSTASRKLKQESILSVSLEDKARLKSFKKFMLEVSKKCYLTASLTTDTNQEHWLYCYMLGKISEKLEPEDPTESLEYYEKASESLHSQNAHYSKRINFHSPHQFSIEALEIFYRVHASIMKYMDRLASTTPDESKKRAHIQVILKYLDHFWRSPFVSSVLPGPYPDSDPRNAVHVARPKSPIAADHVENSTSPDLHQTSVTLQAHSPPPSSSLSLPKVGEMGNDTGLNPAGISSNTPTSVPESSTSDLDFITLTCLKGFTMCNNRFHQHYRSLFRLIHYYARRFPNRISGLSYARSLLLDSNPNPNGLDRSGYFGERKGSNLFNNIWRIPVEEVDRPGAFPTHVFRATLLLLQVLGELKDTGALFAVAAQLKRVPDRDKKYIYDYERQHLYEQALVNVKKILHEAIANIPSSALPHGFDHNHISGVTKRLYIKERYISWRQHKQLLEKHHSLLFNMETSYPIPVHPTTPYDKGLEDIFVIVKKLQEFNMDIFSESLV